MHIIGEKTLNSNAFVCIKWFSMHITGENTVNSYARVHLLVFFAYYW